MHTKTFNAVFKISSIPFLFQFHAYQLELMFNIEEVSQIIDITLCTALHSTIYKYSCYPLIYIYLSRRDFCSYLQSSYCLFLSTKPRKSLSHEVDISEAIKVEFSNSFIIFSSLSYIIISFFIQIFTKWEKKNQKINVHRRGGEMFLQSLKFINNILCCYTKKNICIEKNLR